MGLFRKSYWEEHGLVPAKRKTILVSFYYYEDEPKTSLEDPNDEECTFMDRPDYLFLNDAIEDVMKNYNPTSEIFDVCIDETKPWIFNRQSWLNSKLFKLVRSK